MVNIKDSLKHIGVIILTFCAVFISTIFINFPLDLKMIAHLITDPQIQELYDAQIVMSGIIVACAGGVLGTVTLLVLIFAIGKFINGNSAYMGVLKALGYSDSKIALEYSKFGLSVLVSSVLAYVCGYLFSPLFYKSLSGGAFPAELTFGFHIETILILIVAPTIFFSVMSVLYAKQRLRKKPLDLINGTKKVKINKLTQRLQLQNKSGDNSFVKDLKRTMLYSNLLLIFFVGFAGFGFSAQIQMAFSMRELTPDYLMTVTLIIIGAILGAVTLIIALTFVINSNIKYIAMLKAYGYTDNECNNAMFGGYRIVAYIGFCIGTGYQYMLVKMLVSIFENSYEMPEITFNFLGFFITLAVFALAYEIIMLLYKKRISEIPLREIMQA